MTRRGSRTSTKDVDRYKHDLAMSIEPHLGQEGVEKRNSCQADFRSPRGYCSLLTQRKTYLGFFIQSTPRSRGDRGSQNADLDL